MTEPKRTLRRKLSSIHIPRLFHRKHKQSTNDQAEAFSVDGRASEDGQGLGEASVWADLQEDEEEEAVEESAVEFLYQTFNRESRLQRMEDQCFSPLGSRSPSSYDRSPSSAPLLCGPKGKAKRMSSIAEEERQSPVPQACFGVSTLPCPKSPG